jgi:hypothetical protein
MQVDIEAVRDRHRKQPVERELEPGSGSFSEKRDAAQNAAVPGDRLDDGAERRFVVDGEFDREERDGLKRDAVAPLLAHLGEDRPGDGGLLAKRVEMGADRAAAVCEGAAQREIHARAHVVGIPVRLAVGRDRRARAGMGAVRVRAARPDMPFVDVGVHVDEAGQGDSAAQVDGRQIGRGGSGVGRCEQRDLRAVHDEVAGGEAVGGGVIGKRGRKVGGHARIGDAIGRRFRHDGAGRRGKGMRACGRAEGWQRRHVHERIPKHDRRGHHGRADLAC